MVLSRPENTHRPTERPLLNASRRDFLIYCCQGASAFLVPSPLRGRALPKTLVESGTASEPEYHLHPRYREKTPLDPVLVKTRAGFDSFVLEKYQDQIAALLDKWRSSVLHSPQDVTGLESLLRADFVGPELTPTESRVRRSDEVLDVRENVYKNETRHDRSAFLHQWQSSMASFSKIITAEFQVTSIEPGRPSASISQMPLKTRVRYEIVGSGSDFWREQRVGNWELEWMSTGDNNLRLNNWRVLQETQARSSSPMFADITAQAMAGNDSYLSQLLRGSDYWRTVLDGACGIDIYGHNGISIADIDGDGFDDLYVCQPAGLPNRLYRNRGDGTFEDITVASGLGVLDNTACALFADLDNDGRQDLIVVRTSGPLLFLNRGGGVFRQRPDAFRFGNPPQGTFTGAAVADYDRDGWLDIYFCLYLYYQGTEQYRYPSPYYDAENGPPNFLMRNNRDNTFVDVTAQAGLDKNNTRYSFCCGWNDYNADGWPDLYVVNDFGRKNLYRNNGDGTFTDVAATAGVEDIGAGMSVCWFDYDDDGLEDLYVADMWSAAGERISAQEVFQKDSPEDVRALYHKHAMGNSLLRNQGGNGVFRDTSNSAGVSMGRWSWSSDAWDFDHDGYCDLYITNGMVSGPSREDLNSFFWRQVVANSPRDARPSHAYDQGWNALNELIRADGTWSGYERNVFYLNNRDGTFSDVSGAIDLDFIEDGRAFALADFDHDGRQEMFLKNRNAPQLRALKNVVKNLPPSIVLRLRGTKSNRDAIGAVVTLETKCGHQIRSLQAGSGFLSQHSKELVFGLGTGEGPVRVSIRWPSGFVQQFHDLPVNRRILIAEGSSQPQIEEFRMPSNAVWSPPQRNPQAELPPASADVWLIAPVSAPDFSLDDTAGKMWTLSALRNKPVLLSFWSDEVAACRDQLNLLDQIYSRWRSQGLQLLALNVDNAAKFEGFRAMTQQMYLSFPILRGTDDVAGIYNLLFRYLFDRHRDLPLPTSFLLDDAGKIAKIYQGVLTPARFSQDPLLIPKTASERLARALPFPGVTDATEFQRNYLSLGSVFFQRGYYDPAEESFRLALGEEPDSAEALYGLGSVYLKKGKNNDARVTFERATKGQADYPDTLPNAWNNLGLLATRGGRSADAVPYFQQALKLSPNHLIALENLGNAYRQLKRWDDARATLEQAVAVSPDDAEANYSLGMVFAQTNDTDRAYERLQTALKSRPDYPEALNNLGVLHLRTGRRDEAVSSFEKCIRVAPAFDQAYLNLARVHAIEGNRDKARAVLQELLKEHPGHPQAQKALEDLTN